jgi:hypothetical protein
MKKFTNDVKAPIEAEVVASDASEAMGSSYLVVSVVPGGLSWAVTVVDS